MSAAAFGSGTVKGVKASNARKKRDTKHETETSDEKVVAALAEADLGSPLCPRNLDLYRNDSTDGIAVV